MIKYLHTNRRYANIIEIGTGESRCGAAGRQATGR